MRLVYLTNIICRLSSVVVENWGRSNISTKNAIWMDGSPGGGVKFRARYIITFVCLSPGGEPASQLLPPPASVSPIY